MEIDTIISLVQKSPHGLGCNIRVIIMDEDTNTNHNLKEDLSPKISVHLEKYVCGIVFLSDPGHHKHTVKNHCFDLVGGIRKKVWMVRKEQAEKLANHFGYL